VVRWGLCPLTFSALETPTVARVLDVIASLIWFYGENYVDPEC
jgi:hypothetical protein